MEASEAILAVLLGAAVGVALLSVCINGAPRTAADVLQEIADGLADGSIVLSEDE